MTLPRRTLAVAVALTLALGLSVWATAFTFTPAAFSDGQVLSASDLNDLLNANGQATADALATKVARTGDLITGATAIVADSATLDEGVAATLRVQRTGGDAGYTGLFENFDETNANPTVGIKNTGTGPSLYLLAAGSGPLVVAGNNALNTSLRIEGDGTIRIGNVSGATAQLTLDATDGTIANGAGSGLPVAYGRVMEAGNKAQDASTSNWSVTLENVGGVRYRISTPDFDYGSTVSTTVVTPFGPAPRVASTDSFDGDLLVYLFDAGGTRVTGRFSFVTFKPGQ